MTEESDGSKNAPGSGAGDAAPTQAIPRMTKPAAKKATPPAKGAASKPAPSKSAPSKSAGSKPTTSTSVPSKSAPAKKAAPSSTQTDKGRPRQTTAAAQAKTQPETTRQVKPADGPTGRPLTAADYARTTKTSPAATAVIPAIKDNTKDGLTAKAPSANEAAGVGRRASLRLTHVEPWSVTRLAFAISVAMMIVAVVAVGIFWQVLNFVGVWDQINDSFTTVLSDDTGSFNVTDYFGFGRVMGLTLVLSAVNVILMTVLATIAAHLYNLAAQLMGGVEVTFAEEK